VLMVRIVEAQPLEGYRLRIRFNDDLQGEYAVNPRQRGGVFLQLLDPKVFNAVVVNPEFGCVEWPGGIDLCPTSMPEEMVTPSRAQAAS
jgi:hypothetical protein